jgi:rod shape-determining protein MreD
LSPAAAARLRVAAIVLVTGYIQATFGADLRIAGVAPDLLTLVVICAGLAGGPEQGTVVGFGAGVLADLVVTTTPFGLSALTLTLIGFAVGTLRAGVLHDSWALTPVVAMVATGATVALFVALAGLVGQPQLASEGQAWLVRVGVVEGLYSAVLSIPVTRLLRRAARGSAGVARLAS